MSAMAKLGSTMDLEIDDSERCRLIDDAAWMYTVTVDLISDSTSSSRPSPGFSMSPSKISSLSLSQMTLALSSGRWVRAKSR